MKNIFRLFSILMVAIFFSGCQDVIQIKLDEGSKLYVIDAFVNDLPGKQTIRVTTNDSYFSNRIAPPVANAQVVLKDVTANKEYNFLYTGEGNYDFTVDTNVQMCIVDHQYQLNVTIDGDTYTALTTQKRTASIDSISYELFVGGGFGPPSEVPFYLCTLWAKDKSDNNTDYYWIKTFRNDSLLFGPSNINLAIDGTNGPVTNVDVDSTAFTPPITFLGFNFFYGGNSCTAQIHSISRDTYFFFLQAQAQITNGGLFATTPENVKTNIVTPKDAKTKAVGWYSVSTVASKRIVIP